MSDFGKAVFLSYASQDADAAKRIADDLRVAGVEVWFDRSELVGGDAWDQKIRKQIKECALLIPIISANTQQRTEGYFRLEWRLADQRTHLMAKGRAFLLPVVIDDTRDSDAHVPDSFTEVQWTRLPAGETPPAFAQRVKKLLDGGPSSSEAASRPRGPASQELGPPGKKSRLWLVPVIAAAVFAGLWQQQRNRAPDPAVEPKAAASPAAGPIAEVHAPGAKAKADNPEAALAPSGLPQADQKSVAVLAFANLSDDKANEYFSDGISEELLNVLAKVPGLKVSARTSAFYFKGKEMPIPEIAQQLGVAYIIEGSVRKQGSQVRIRAQLVKAADGFPVWSDTFTRDLKDIFAVQDEIAGLIAQQLQLKLGGAARTVAPIKPEAFELYVQARRAWNLRNAAGFAQAEELLTRALTLEPDFARAHAALADVWTLRAIANGVIDTFGQRTAPVFTQITSEIQKALALDPDSSEARASLGLIVRLQQWNLPAAERELRRAIELNPNYATAHHWLGTCLFESGRIDEGLVELRRAAELDPFSLRIVESYAEGLVHAGRHEEGLVVLGRAEALQAKAPLTLFTKAEALLQLGRRVEAIAVARELGEEDRAELLARAGEKSEAEAALADAEGWSRYQLLTALGRTAEAIAALRAEDVSVAEVGNWLLDPALDPYRQDPHFVKLLATLGLTEAHARMQAWRAARPTQAKQ